MTPITVKLEVVREDEEENVHILHIIDDVHCFEPSLDCPPEARIISTTEIEVDIFIVNNTNATDSPTQRNPNTYAVPIPLDSIPTLGLDIKINILNELNEVLGHGRGKVRNPSVKIITRPLLSQDKVK